MFHTWSYGIFVDIHSNLRRKKIHRTNERSNFLVGTFSSQDNVRAQIQFRNESQPQHLKRWFFLRNRPSIFTSIAPAFLDKLNETSSVFPALKSTCHFLPQSTVSRRSGSSSDANSSCCHRSAQIRCLITFRVGSIIIRMDSNITDNIIRKVINV